MTAVRAPLAGPRAADAAPARAVRADAVADRLARAAGTGDEAALRAAARSFEAWFLEQVFSELRASPLTQESHALGTFQGMLDQEWTERAAGAGGFGLADRIVDSVRRRAGATAYAGPAVPLSQKPGSAAPLPAARPGYRWPLDAMPRTLGAQGDFGPRSDPLTREDRDHKGVDLGAPTGTPIHPIAPGRVVEAGPRGGFGNLVVVDHGDGVRSYYAHASRVLVKPGDGVTADTAVAEVGSTGRSTSPHLHLEVRVDGVAVDPVEWVGDR